MKQRMTLAVLAITALLTLGRAASAADVVPGEYLVKYKGSSFLSTTTLRSVGGMRILSENTFGKLLKVTIAPGQEARTLSSLANNPNVAYVVPNVKVYSYLRPVNMKDVTTSARLQDQWALGKVRAQDAWTRAGNKGSHSVTVAVIDTGADYNHESLKPNMVQGYDFKDNTTDPMDKTSSGGNPGHGTHCSGIIGGTGLVDGGIIGISPEVSIMPLRFLGEDGSGDLDSAIKAVDFAIQHKVQVISASWGASVDAKTAQPLIEAVKRADDAGVIFVTAAANDGADNDTTSVYPANANWANTITVAASDSGDNKPSWSNYGKKNVHLASPGDNIMSTLPGNKYGPLSGTSMATPLVAGLVAFLKAQDSSLTGAETRSLLQLTGAKVNISTACNCRVDALAAVDSLLKKTLFISPAAKTVAVGDTLQFEGHFGKAPFTYTVSDASVGTIDANGAFKGTGNGSTTVTVKDATGASSTSLEIRVGSAPSNGGGDNGGGGGDDDGGGGGFPGAPGGGGGGGGLPGAPGGGGGGGGAGSCPIGDQSTCDALCKMQPTMPFCHH